MNQQANSYAGALALAGALVLAAGSAPAQTAPPNAAKMAAPAPKPAAAMAFTPAELDLAPGEIYPVTLFVPSPTGKYHSGELSYAVEKGVSLHPDPRWPERMPPWGVKVFPKIKAASDAEGRAKVVALLMPGNTLATLLVTIRRPEVTLIPGIRELRIRITNPMRGRPLKGRIGLTNPDRFLQDITSRLVSVAPGATQELQIPLPGAAPSVTETYAFTYTLQTWAGYREQKTQSLRFPPQRPASDVREEAR
jgi:hypothetical protein